MKRQPGSKGIDLHTLNRDLQRAPAEVKSHHVVIGPHSKLVIGPSWVSTGRWTARLVAIKYGNLLTPAWLRMSELGIVSQDRRELITAILRLKGDLTILTTLTTLVDEADHVKRLGAVGPLSRFRRTQVRYVSDHGAVFTLYKAKPKEGDRHEGAPYVGIDDRFADLFGLTYVWSDGKDVYDNPDPSRVNVVLNGSGLLPEEVAFALMHSQEEDHQ